MISFYKKISKLLLCQLILFLLLANQLLIAQHNTKDNIFKKEISFGKTILPDTVPWLNSRDEKYFIGNGIVGGGGNTPGVWDLIIGPDYTSPNFIKSEKLNFIIDNENKNLQFNFHRVSGSGVFYGSAKFHNAVIHVVDFIPFNEPFIIRHLIIENISKNEPLSIKVVSEIKKGKGIKEVVSNDKNALLLHADTKTPLFGNGDGGNWKDRHLLILFNTEQTLTSTDSVLLISTQSINIPARKFKEVSLCHYLFENEMCNINRTIEDIYQKNIAQNLVNTLKTWQKWVRSGKKISNNNNRVQDIIESILVGIKMQQNRCGGFLAGARIYSFSYIRDSHGACRGLLSCGHTKEVEKYLEITYHKFKIFNQIPNSVQMGADLFIHANGNQFAECPAYVLLLARDYYKYTKDIGLLIKINDLLKYAIDIQLSHAKDLNWILPFNGDETEQYCVKENGQIYGGFPALSGFDRNNWSMSSVAACIASLDFYIQYLKIRKMDNRISEYENYKQKLLKSITQNFFNNKLGYIDWAKKKDNSFYPYRVVNFELMPVWFGASLPNMAEKVMVEKMIPFLNSQTGFIATAPTNVEGFCGNSLAYFLYDLTILNNPLKDKVFDTLINSALVQKFGMVNEFYGPSGVPNPHNLRCFESGIVLDAIIKYIESRK
jgi:hypothetical protein